MWQVLYEELKDQGIVFIAVALDAGGAAAVRPRVLCEDIDERPDVLRQLMGWSEDHWSRQAPPQYPCLIDTEHVVADLYHVHNVPQAVWIDEEGRIVRPTETAGFGDGFRRMDQETFAIPQEDADKSERNRARYVDALRDWVANGPDSYAAMTPEEVRERIQVPGEDDVRAAAHARLGGLCLQRGDHDGAERQFREATKLAPDKWNYRRQSMVVSEELIGELNVAPEYWQALEDLGEKDYYAPMELPGVERF